ncbi:MAG: autotransporter outer membrane beta-barrel domain-containing protein [Comamonadaceae bacterium]|nr:MAG: autotransporter outer membrane beta-barrel domain-containing protein [Comamonadaceae bacterium]
MRTSTTVLQVAPVPTAKSVASAVTGSVGHAQAVTHMILGGSHHRPLMSYGTAGPDTQNCFWATGDVGRLDNRSSKGRLAEIGLCRDFASGTLRAGVGIGSARQTQNQDNSGFNRLSGNHVVGEVNYRLPSGPLLSATGVLADWDLDIRRGYLASTGLDVSSGTTRLRSASLRLRADWVDAWGAGPTRFTPYAALTAGRTRIDGYTETGGGMPAQFNAQKHSSLESRLGVASTYALDNKTSLRGSVEGVHRFGGDGPTVTGQLLGQYSFSETASATRQTWARVGLDLDRQLSRNTMVSISANAATEGDDPRLAAAVTLRVGF